MTDVVSTLTALLKPVVEAMGFEFIGCEYRPQGREAVLRLYIDKPDGISSDECGQVSRQVSSVLDVEDPISRNYRLEVSSPGWERPLFILEQYVPFIGHKVRIRLHSLMDERRNFVGLLTEVGDDFVILDVDGDRVRIDYSNIEKAHLVVDFDKTGHKR